MEHNVARLGGTHKETGKGARGQGGTGARGWFARFGTQCDVKRGRDS